MGKRPGENYRPVRRRHCHDGLTSYRGKVEESVVRDKYLLEGGAGPWDRPGKRSDRCFWHTGQHSLRDSNPAAQGLSVVGDQAWSSEERSGV